MLEVVLKNGHKKQHTYIIEATGYTTVIVNKERWYFAVDSVQRTWCSVSCGNLSYLHTGCLHHAGLHICLAAWSLWLVPHSNSHQPCLLSKKKKSSYMDLFPGLFRSAAAFFSHMLDPCWLFFYLYYNLSTFVKVDQQITKLQHQQSPLIHQNNEWHLVLFIQGF